MSEKISGDAAQIQAWSQSATPPSGDPSRPPGNLRLQGNSLTYVPPDAKLKWHERIARRMEWGSWNPQKIAHYLHTNSEAIRTAGGGEALEQYAAHTFSRNFSYVSTSKVADFCAKILNRSELTLQKLSNGTGIAIPRGLAQYHLDTEARMLSPFEEIVRHNKYARAQYPQNPTRAQKKFVDLYNQALDSTIATFELSAQINFEGNLTRPLSPDGRLSGAVDDVISMMRGPRKNLLFQHLQRLLNTYTDPRLPETQALRANLSYVMQQLPPERKLEWIHWMGEHALTPGGTENVKFLLEQCFSVKQFFSDSVRVKKLEDAVNAPATYSETPSSRLQALHAKYPDIPSQGTTYGFLCEVDKRDQLRDLASQMQSLLERRTPKNALEETILRLLSS